MLTDVDGTVVQNRRSHPDPTQQSVQHLRNFASGHFRLKSTLLELLVFR